MLILDLSKIIIELKKKVFTESLKTFLNGSKIYIFKLLLKFGKF